MFAGVEELGAGDAETICAALLGRLSRDGVRHEVLMCFGSDGASVMTGIHTGVAARLLRLCPFLLAVHCILHREALAVTAASNEIDYARVTFFLYIELMGRFFRDSGSRTALFEQAQLNRNLKVLKLKVSAFTRWLSHDNTTSVARRRILPLFDALKELGECDAKALGLYYQTSTYAFVGWLLHSCDVLPVLASLSGLWQARELDVSALARDLPITIATLEDLIVRPGQSFLQLPAFISEIETGGHVVRTRDEAWLETHRKKWLRSLVDHLKAYFPNMPLMLAAYNLLNPHAALPKSASDEFMNYGMEDLATICDHFCVSRGDQDAVIDKQDLLASLEIDAQIPQRQEDLGRCCRACAGGQGD